MEASSPMISDVMSVPMTFMSTRAPPGCRLTKEETSRTAPSTITQERPFKIWIGFGGGVGGAGEGGGALFLPHACLLLGTQQVADWSDC